jgi:hypothetical protein
MVKRYLCTYFNGDFVVVSGGDVKISKSIFKCNQMVQHFCGPLHRCSLNLTEKMFSFGLNTRVLNMSEIH